MLKHCPNPRCLSPHLRKFGTFRRRSDGKLVKRWLCKRCNLHFSSPTCTSTYRQHKRHLNGQIHKLLSSGVSMRRTALLLGIHRTTVARKLAFLAAVSRHRQDKVLHAQPKAEDVQFDDLITVEHTKCKPLAISLAVEAPSRRILGFAVSRIPASGPWAALSRRKYGPRPNQRPQGLQRLFTRLRGLVSEGVSFRSDEDPLYAVLVRRHFPKAVHTRHAGGRGCSTGQGELKQLRFDPLFSLNHTCAMLRANINRLFRRTWCTTKKRERLEQHLAVYLDFHNRVLLKGGVRPVRSAKEACGLGLREAAATRK